MELCIITLLNQKGFCFAGAFNFDKNVCLCNNKENSFIKKRKGEQ